MSFIKVHTKNYIIVHGYDENNKEIEEKIEMPKSMEKLIAIHRIQSISEKYILTTYSHGRYIYWEYEERYEDLINILREKGILVN